ncbi:MAG TPA: aminotransferase class I/II-fold pyridoxal phosphate-dependent enzyme, partial [Candidatus Atribacteria bacterium]|nr:aminotransferase class I/II-fold pyridoxal phosphate-dependent enzyme [Candidatus Atribacteria bacterium]
MWRRYMQAIILAAGRGNRLRPITDKIPKSLVEINGISFIENDLNALSKHEEVNEVIIIIGYKKELIKKKIGNSYRGLRIIYVENDEWATTNNIYSLWLAKDLIKEDFILMEGDIFFEHDILDYIFKNKDKNIAFLSKYFYDMFGTVVEIDERGSKSTSDTLIEVDTEENRIKRLIPGSEQGIDFDYSNKYKTVNIYYFTYEFYKNYFKPNLDLYIKTHGVKSYYEIILGMLIYLNTLNIYGHIIDRKKWYEIDTENDLEMANYLFSKKEEKINKIENLYGGYWRYDFTDFCFLFNLYFPPSNLYLKLAKELPLLINNYPSAQHKISSLLAQWYTDEGFNKENILVGNGASEFIRIFNRQFIKKITIPVPSFNEYEDLNESKINYLILSEEENFKIDPDKFIESAINSNSNFAVIINPNNPTSTVTSREDIIKILENLKHLEGIIIDESFIDFTGNRDRYSVQPFVNQFHNLIVLRSLSKEFGIPGLRLGYILTSNKKIKKKVKKYLPIWNINSVAERFLELFPRYQREYEKSIKKIIDDREKFLAQLKKIKMLK